MPDENYSDNRQISVADFIENAPAELAIEVLAGANGLRNKYIASRKLKGSVWHSPFNYARTSPDFRRPYNTEKNR